MPAGNSAAGKARHREVLKAKTGALSHDDALRIRAEQLRTIHNAPVRVYEEIADELEHVADFEGVITQINYTRGACIVTMSIPHAYNPIVNEALARSTYMCWLRLYAPILPEFDPFALTSPAHAPAKEE